jgi:hypothetical protein
MGIGKLKRASVSAKRLPSFQALGMMICDTADITKSQDRKYWNARAG